MGSVRFQFVTRISQILTSLRPFAEPGIKNYYKYKKVFSTCTAEPFHLRQSWKLCEGASVQTVLVTQTNGPGFPPQCSFFARYIWYLTLLLHVNLWTCVWVDTVVLFPHVLCVCVPCLVCARFGFVCVLDVMTLHTSVLVRVCVFCKITCFVS